MSNQMQPQGNYALTKTEDEWRVYMANPKVMAGIDKYCKESGVTPEQIVTGFALAIRKSILGQTGNRPIIPDCTEYSVMTCVLKSAQLGLIPDGSEAALAPFRNNKQGTVEATFMPMYRGLVKVGLRNPEVLSITAGAIRENDHYECQRGSNAMLVHIPPLNDRGKLIGAWALAKMANGEEVSVQLGEKDIARHRRPSKNDHLWNDEPEGNAEPMWTKSAIHELIKWLPSRELQRVEELERVTEKPMVIDVQDMTDTPKTQTERVKRQMQAAIGQVEAVQDMMEAREEEDVPAFVPGPTPQQPQTEPDDLFHGSDAEPPSGPVESPGWETDEEISAEMAGWREELKGKRKAETIEQLMNDAQQAFPARRMDLLNTFLAECRAKIAKIGGE
jgi:recombination protein RecT